MSNHTQRHPNLPLISTLLSPCSPPTIVIEDPNKADTSRTYSPMMSPIDSYASSLSSLSPRHMSLSPIPSFSSASSPFLPPLQGDDPPRLLRHPSFDNNSSSPNLTTTPLWGAGNLFRRTSIPKSPLPSCPPEIEEEEEDADATRLSLMLEEERPPLPPSTEIVMSESGQPILKRRRGRPPNMREPSLEGGWTFLTPTVWDVKPAISHNLVETLEETTPSQTSGDVASFSSSNLDTVLQMPRKKRGRKPKTHIVGNSCFVWKDISSTRRSGKKEQANHQHYPHHLRRLEKAPSANNSSSP